MGTVQSRFLEIRTREVGSLQVGFKQDSMLKLGTGEIGAFKVQGGKKPLHGGVLVRIIAEQPCLTLGLSPSSAAKARTAR